MAGRLAIRGDYVAGEAKRAGGRSGHAARDLQRRVSRIRARPIGRPAVRERAVRLDRDPRPRDIPLLRLTDRAGDLRARGLDVEGPGAFAAEINLRRVSVRIGSPPIPFAVLSGAGRRAGNGKENQKAKERAQGPILGRRPARSQAPDLGGHPRTL